MVRKSINQVLVSILGKSDGIEREIQRTKGSILETLGNISLIGTGIGQAFNLAGRAVTGLSSTVLGAQQDFNDLIVAASGFADVSGLSFSQSEDYLADLRVSIAASAKELGDTTTYQMGLVSGVVDEYTALLKNTGEFTTDELTNQLRNFSQNVGNYFENAGVGIGDANLAITKFLTGVSEADLKTIDFYRNQPALINRINREAEKLGKTFEELSVDERLRLAENVFTLDEEAKRKLSTSLTTTLNAVKSSFIDPIQGLFGFLREVTIGGQETTVLTEVQNLVSNFLSETGPLQAIYEGLGLFGKIGDPMVALSKVIRGINDRILPIIRNVVDTIGGVSPVSFDFGGILQNISVTVGNFINRIVQNIGSFAENTDNGQIAAIGGQIITSIGQGILAFFTTVDWLALFQAIGQVSIDGISLIVGGIFASLGQSVTAWGEIAASIFNAAMIDLKSRWNFAIASLKAGFQSGLERLRSGIETVRSAFAPLTGIITTIAGSVNSLIGGLRVAANTIRAVSNVASNAGSMIPGMADGYIPSTPLGNILSSAVGEINRAPSGSRLLLANSSEAILNRGQQMQIASQLTGGKNINITINGNDPFTIAREIEARMNRIFSNNSKFA